ncbi:hemK methyltransferase 2 [Oratosquilla oratoria]|uniref:hemK methyltransferase 2 n=1 Tax=Oratosquilla oratoria TaxID=337810 RepID=UPI003F765C57
MMETKIKTPDFSHITSEDLEHIYEPSEDTFLLIDALEKDLELIVNLKPSLCLEVGSGSGVVITALGTSLGSGARYIATDINPRACHITQMTGERNGVHISAVNTDLVTDILPNVTGCVDILLFNPPYVVTPHEEVGQGDLEHTWAGGHKGRQVMDRLFPIVPLLLSRTGVFYLVAIRENDLDDIAQVMKGHGLSCEHVISRRAGPEHLTVLKFCVESD